MSTSKDLVQHILENLEPLDVRARAMFGSYGLYCDEKFVGIISGEHLYIKRSSADPYLFKGTDPAPPFPGARDWHRVPARRIEDADWLRDAVSETAAAIPAPQPRRRGAASGVGKDNPEWLDGPPDRQRRL